MSNVEVLDSVGKCPKCESENVCWSTPHDEGCYLYYEGTCSECGTFFHERYDYSQSIIVEEGMANGRV